MKVCNKKNENYVVLRSSSNMIGNSDDETNFLHKSLLINRQVANFRKAFTNNSLIGIKLSKTQLLKMIQLGEFLGRLLRLLLKTGLPLIKNVVKPLAKSVSVPLGLTAAGSAADAGKHKKILGSGTPTLIILNDEIKDSTKIAKSLQDSGILLKGVSEAIQSEAK